MGQITDQTNTERQGPVALTKPRTLPAKKWKKVEDHWTFRSGWGKNVRIPGCGSDSKESESWSSGDQQAESSWSEVESTGKVASLAGVTPAKTGSISSTRSWSWADCSNDVENEQVWNEIENERAVRWETETSQESDDNWSCCGSVSCKGLESCQKGCAEDFAPWSTSK